MSTTIQQEQGNQSQNDAPVQAQEQATGDAAQRQNTGASGANEQQAGDDQQQQQQQQQQYGDAHIAHPVSGTLARQQQQLQQQQALNQQYQQQQQQQSQNQMNQSHSQSQFYKTAPENGIRDFYSKRRERQQAQKDAEILANRIALLKQEEIRTLKKIEETRKKALEVYYLKLKNDARLRRKKEVVEARRAQLQVPRRKSQERYEEERPVPTKEEWVKMKRDNVNYIKEQTRANEERIQRQREEHIQKAREKKTKIAEDKRQARQRVDEHRFGKMMQIAVEVDHRAKAEEQNKLAKLNEIKRMEEYEIELIQRLKQTQSMQQNAYEELENALMLSAQDFAQRYLTQEGAVEGGGDNFNQNQTQNQDSSTLKQSKSQPDLRVDNVPEENASEAPITQQAQLQ